MPDEGFGEPKYVALCDMTLKCYVGMYISFVNYTGKHNWMHPNKITETIAVCSQIHTKNTKRVGQKVEFSNFKPMACNETS